MARDTDVVGALNWAASALDLPTLADSGYDGAGQGIKTPIKQPAGGQVLAADNQTYNACTGPPAAAANACGCRKLCTRDESEVAQ